jgi:hypothetical protein
MPETTLTLTEQLLPFLDGLRPGDWLALAPDNAPMLEPAPSVRLDVPFDRAAAAVFELLTISRHTRRPLLSWAAERDDPGFADYVSAVTGLAADATGGRPVVTPIPDAVLVESAVHVVRAAVRVPSDIAPFLFLVCVGGGPHQPTDILLETARGPARPSLLACAV